MDLATFVAKVQTFSRFPEPLRQYAVNVAGKLDDAKRAALLTKIEKEYGEFVVLDDNRLKQQDEMIDELVAFRKANFPKLQKMAEAGERAEADSDFDAKFDAADKQSKSPKKKK